MEINLKMVYVPVRSQTEYWHQTNCVIFGRHSLYTYKDSKETKNWLLSIPA